MTLAASSVLIHPAEKTSAPWANGRGSTRELAHDVRRSWRLTIADIGQDAPFSTFPGVDRIFIVVDGEVPLRVDGVEHVLVAGAAVKSSSEVTGGESGTALSFLRFTEPVAVYRLTPRS